LLGAGRDKGCEAKPHGLAAHNIGETSIMADKRNRADAGSGKGESRPAEPGKRRGRGGTDERWLERKIRDMYQEVVDEPVPDDILKILNRIPKLG
jgi:hypothetical protein